MKKVDWRNENRFDKIYEVLVRIEERLKVIEESVKKEETKKQLLND
jgi:hypothetical protein|tara:strand:+ start:2690 stop:2827 length:138 start_codon:yes stop_codon:yes gene_type:complete